MKSKKFLLSFGKNDGDCQSLFLNLETDFAKQEQKTTTTATIGNNK
jgi:hypothetical protein